jgi:hypothetical protein
MASRMVSQLDLMASNMVVAMVPSGSQDGVQDGFRYVPMYFRTADHGPDFQVLPTYNHGFQNGVQ